MLRILRALLLPIGMLLLFPLALLAQTVTPATVTPPASPSFLAGIVSTLLPIIVAALTVVGFELLQKAVTVIDALPAPIKQVLVGVISYLLTAGSAALGIHLSTTDITGLSGPDVSALLSSGLAFIFHLSAAQKATAIATGAKVGP